MPDKNWQCPYCKSYSMLRGNDFTYECRSLTTKVTKDGPLVYEILAEVCLNSECREYAICLKVGKGGYNHATQNHEMKKVFYSWQVKPFGHSMTFPDFIPAQIREDYQEACSIQNLSPKASATLARRCLQGILRDFWKVKPATLYKEIDEVKDKVQPEVWEAMDACRKVGNIGAHMEKDINIIIDVDPDEAGKLIGLIEMLLEEWYVAREHRRARLAELKKLGDEKTK